MSSNDNYLGAHENPRHSAYKYVFKLLIPMSAAGIIIGKSGAVIKEMSELSSCKMLLADAQDVYNTKERIMTISSEAAANIIKGLHAVVAQFFSEPTMCVYQNHRLVYGRRDDTVFRGAPGGFGQPANYGSMGYQGAYPTTSYEYMQPFAGPQMTVSRYQVDQMAASCGLSAPVYNFDGRTLEITLGIPSAWIGIILGKGGSALKETMALSRTAIQVSQKEGPMDNQAIRTLKIKGQESNSNYAYSLIVESLYRKIVQQKDISSFKIIYLLYTY
jgi:hypothetical protein